MLYNFLYNFFGMHTRTHIGGKIQGDVKKYLGLHNDEAVDDEVALGMQAVIMESQQQSVMEGSSKILAFCKEFQRIVPGFKYLLIKEKINGKECIVGTYQMLH